MISTSLIHEYLTGELERRNLFLIEANVRPGNKIVVYIDSMKGVTLDECIAVSRYLENRLDRTVEDFELEVSSPGLDKPLKLPVQFEKNTGRILDIVKTDGIKISGKLHGISDGVIRIETDVVFKDQATGKKKTERRVQEIKQDEIKTAKVVISVKK
ncbi:MAG TPA: ribosome assembly cofactor RimP [Bacteroidales bacterium]|jgi:ribosome maturation factor RimP|nr:ribosome assembly cofactor RimP [Bacteroidales bacterium]